jgi:hypothetical protein
VIPFDALRRAVALAHRIEGAELLLRRTDGRLLTSSRRPGADLDPCELRRALLLGACGAGPTLHEHLDGLEVGGSLTARGGGVFEHHDRAERWTSTVLSPDAARVLLAAHPGLAVHADADISLHGDPSLGVTLVRMVDAGRVTLDDLAVGVAAAVTVADLLSEVSASAR